LLSASAAEPRNPASARLRLAARASRLRVALAWSVSKRPEGARSEAQTSELGWSGLCPGRDHKRKRPEGARSEA